MKESIKFAGRTDYNVKFPPNNAKKGYVAKITGRASGAVKYEREFFGGSVEILLGDADALYEIQHGEKKGGYERRYNVVLNHPEHGLICSTTVTTEPLVAKIAKMLDEGHAMKDIIDVQNLRAKETNPEFYLFDCAIRSPAKAEKSAKSATIASAVDACWQILSLMPDDQRNQVLEEIRSKMKISE
jgi:hypothetical protein